MAITYVRSATANDDNVTIDCGSAATDRVLVLYAHVEGDMGWLTSVAADGKAMTLVDRIETNDAFGQIEMWYIDEDVLTTSNGSINIALTGGSADYILNAMLFTGAHQEGPTDYGSFEDTTETDVVVTGIDSDDGSVIIMGSFEGTGGGSTSSWTSPLTERSSQAGSSNTQKTASAIESTGQSGKTYTHVWSAERNRIAGIVAVWAEAGDETEYLITGVTYDKSGVIEGSCDVYLLRDNGDDTLTFVAHTTSHATTGVYSFQDTDLDTADHIVIAYLDGSPDTHDATDHVLEGEEQ